MIELSAKKTEQLGLERSFPGESEIQKLQHLSDWKSRNRHCQVLSPQVTSSKAESRVDSSIVLLFHFLNSVPVLNICSPLPTSGTPLKSHEDGSGTDTDSRVQAHG